MNSPFPKTPSHGFFPAPASDRPSDVRIGWRTLGVRPQRLAAVGSIMADVADEEIGYDNIDTVVGISINGIAFAYEVARVLESDMTVFRTTDEGEGSGSLSNKYGQVAGKRVVIIDDVLSSGKTLSKTIQSIRALVETSPWPSFWSTRRHGTKSTMSPFVA